MTDDAPPDDKPVDQIADQSAVASKPRRGRRSRRQRGLARSRSISTRHTGERSLALLRLSVLADRETVEENQQQRPRNRAECRDGQRPCPWVGCPHHLYLDVNPRTGSIKINFPDLEPWELAETCELDVSERGPHTLEEIAELTNLTRERVRQVELKGCFAYRAAAVAAGMGPEDLALFAHPGGSSLPDHNGVGDIRVGEAAAAPAVEPQESDEP